MASLREMGRAKRRPAEQPPLVQALQAGGSTGSTVMSEWGSSTAASQRLMAAWQLCSAQQPGAPHAPGAGAAAPPGRHSAAWQVTSI